MKERISLVLLVLSIIPMIANAQTRVPLPSWLSNHNEWRRYQLDPYQTWVDVGKRSDNMNCGPASVAMVFHYFLNINLSTTYATSPVSAQAQYDCWTEARWNYCRANGFPNGFTNAYSGYNDSDEIINVIESEGLNTQIVTGSQNVTLARIRSEIDNGNLVICHVDADEYYNGGYYTHWVIAFGYDNDDIIIHDPGYITLVDYPIPNNDFYNALYHANNKNGNKMILIVVSNSSYPPTCAIGEFAPGVTPPSGLPQKFVDAHNYALSKGTDLGQPFNNNNDHNGGPYVHNWDGLDSQDWKNEAVNPPLWSVAVYNPDTDYDQVNQVYAAIGQIRLFWLNNNGPTSFGPFVGWEQLIDYLYTPHPNSTYILVQIPVFS